MKVCRGLVSTLLCRVFVISLVWNTIVVNSLSGQQQQQHKKRPRIPILQYHDDWVCVDKPSGITVHRGNGFPRNKPVLTSRVKRQLSRKVFPVHRLDHRTSGVMLFAFDSTTAGILHDAAIRKGQKEYLALVRGHWKRDESVVFVDKPLVVKGIEKEALTKFTLLGTVKGETSQTDNEDDATAPTSSCSLLLCEPLTGRTHQIRRHAYSLGHPILGDTQHGDSRANRYWRKRKLNRLALHCSTVSFELDGTRHECHAPLPSRLKGILQSLPLWEEANRHRPSLALDAFDMIDGTHGRSYRKRLLEQNKENNE